MKNTLILLIFLSFIFASFAWNRADTNKAIETINSKQQKSGLWESLYETYSAVQTLDMLGAKNINNKENICKGLTEQSNKLTKPSDIYYLLATYKKLKCGEVSTQIVDTLKGLLAKPDELTTEELRYLVGNIPLVGAEKLGSNLGKLVEIITDRMEDKGIFRSLKDVEDASVLNAGHAFRALAQLYRLKVSNKEQREMLETSIDLLPDLVKTANKGQYDTVYFSDSKRDNVETTSVVIEGIFTLLTSIKKSKVPPAFTSSVQGISNFFVSSKTSSGNPSDIFQVVRSLYLLSRNSLQRSVNVNLLNPSISTNALAEDRYIKVEVSNALGEAINGIKVYLAKARSIKSSTVLVERQLMDPKENSTTNTLYLFNLFAAKPLPGSYSLTFRIVPEGKDNYFEAFTTDLSISIVTAISLTGSTVIVSDNNSKDNTAAKRLELNYPNDFSVGNVSPSQHVFFTFRVKNEKTQKPFVVSQAVVRVVNERTGEEINVIAYPKGTLYSAHFDFSSRSNFWALGGVYQAYLIVGDAHIEKGIYWKAFHFELPADASKAKPSVWSKKAPIDHVFRVPEKRPPAIVSLVFAGLVLAPILIIFIGLGITGFTFGKLPVLGAIYYILFIAGICLIAFVIVLYWLALNMFTALYYISILLVATVFVGQRALRTKALAATEVKVKTD